MALRRYTGVEVRVIQRDTPPPHPVFLQPVPGVDEFVSLPEVLKALDEIGPLCGRIGRIETFIDLAAGQLATVVGREVFERAFGPHGAGEYSGRYMKPTPTKRKPGRPRKAKPKGAGK